MRKLLKALFIPSLASLAVFAQEPAPKPNPPANAPAPSPCPVLSIQNPTPQPVREGQRIFLMANVGGGDNNVVPSIIWDLTAGSILNGQGTRRVEVDTTGGGTDRQIMVVLWIGGFAPECANQVTTTIRVVPPAKKVDEFGDLPIEEENKRVAALAEYVSASNDSVYVIAYAGRTNERGYAANALRRLRGLFIAKRMEPQRVAANDGGFREQPAYEIWIVADGAEPPRPTPTVDRKEIVFPKAAPPKKP